MADKAPITFTNKDTAEKFEAVVAEDITIHVPGKKKPDNISLIGGYAGPLSAVPVAVAEGMAKRGSNLLKEKEATPPKAVANKGGSIS